ncbi:chromosomal replication initiator protein DnaA [Patescibacteria group bacterium]|nr:chromosomal replication initiator protein DnaA [Patescibacteria group bacterium]
MPEEQFGGTAETKPAIKTAENGDRPDVLSLWRGVQASLNIILSQMIYNTWILPTTAENFTENSLDIVCPSALAAKQLQTYKSLIQNSVNEIGKGNYELNFIVREPDKDTKSKIRNKGKKESGDSLDTPLFKEVTGDLQNSDHLSGTIEHSRKAGLASHFVFENFVMGPNNQLAYSVAWSVANDPGKDFTPMFLYSGVGLGKTHLLHAIGNHIIKHKPHLNVVYTTSEQFTNELVNVLQSSHQTKKVMTERFRKKFREADVLLVDDIQFIVGRDSTQEEFFHTFNQLYLDKKQIVLTSDRPPKDFNNLEERLTSRFGSGIIVDIQKPTVEMRNAILRKKRDRNGDPVTNEVIDFIAAKVSTNIRELEGAYLQVLTHIRSSGLEMNVKNAAAALGQIIEEKQEMSNPNDILNAVCRYFSITKADLKGPRRTKQFVIPRQIAMYLLKEMTGTPLMAIGDLLGGRDHTTIIHGADKIKQDLQKIPRVEQDVRNIKQLLYME